MHDSADGPKWRHIKFFFLLTPLIIAKLSGKMVVQLKKILISS